MPDITVRTSLIVGFPGETQEDFDILENFIKDVQFDRLGVFTYSKEEDTPAFKMEGQVASRVKKQRQKRLMDIQAGISKDKNQSKLGKVYEVLVEGIAEDGIFYYGRTRSDAPDIDGVFYMTSPFPLETGKLVRAKVLDTGDYDLTGEVIDESGK
jgi:ribosomal protein S12 methylthiotransferase